MARTLLDLANDLDGLNGKVSVASSEHAKKVALTIVGDLAYHTPVDTSKALSNWDVTLDAPASGKHGPHYPGKHGSTFSQSAAETLERAKAILANKQPGQSIFITNNLPYIKRLNEGYSAQAPAGFVERALLLARKLKANFTLRK
jgi:hypothetical protein